MNSEDELRLSYESILYDKNTELGFFFFSNFFIIPQQVFFFLWSGESGSAPNKIVHHIIDMDAKPGH